VGEEAGDVGGTGAGGDVVVLGHTVEEEVADASADEPGGVAGGAKSRNDFRAVVHPLLS
jgi:hypothetical protein